MKDKGNDFASEEKCTVKKPYERAAIKEHEPLEEATATTYYYYTYTF
jgi:hypothetical protein